MCGLLPNQLSACVCVCVCQMHMRERSLLPDIRSCLRMASLIRSYVTSSVQLTSAFLVMLGKVPDKSQKRGKTDTLLISRKAMVGLIFMSDDTQKSDTFRKGLCKRHLSRVRASPRSGKCVCRPAWCRCSGGRLRPGSSGLGIEP